MPNPIYLGSWEDNKAEIKDIFSIILNLATALKLVGCSITCIGAKIS